MFYSPDGSPDLMAFAEWLSSVGDFVKILAWLCHILLSLFVHRKQEINIQTVAILSTLLSS
jgi:hypothetical protein